MTESETDFTEFETDEGTVIETEIEDEIELFDIVPKESRITDNYLSKAELARVISTRVAQIENGAPHYAKTTSDDTVEIAIIELRDYKCPLIISRETPFGIEKWAVNEMNYHPDYFNRDDKLAFRILD